MLSELLDPRAIAPNYPAADAEDVIRYLSAKLLDAGYVRDSFADAALSREAELPTGLVLGGDINAAIPHTDVEHVLKPAVALATLSLASESLKPLRTIMKLEYLAGPARASGSGSSTPVSLATSSRRLDEALKKKARRGAKTSSSRPASRAVCT